MLTHLPLASFTSILGIVLVIVFFVTSSDSGSLVIDTITAGGKTDAPVAQRVFWCTFEGLVAAALLLVGGAGALTALQAMAVRSEEHTSELQSLMRISYAVFCLKKKKQLQVRHYT